MNTKTLQQDVFDYLDAAMENDYTETLTRDPREIAEELINSTSIIFDHNLEMDNLTTVPTIMNSVTKWQTTKHQENEK